VRRVPILPPKLSSTKIVPRTMTTPDPLNYRPAQSAVYYTGHKSFESGRLSVSVIAIALAITIASIIYAKIQPELYSLYLRSGACVCAGIALGILTLVPVRVGRVRQPAVASIIGTVLGLLALYVIWIVWVHDAIHTSGFPITYHMLLTHPVIDLHLIKDINRFGTWTWHGEAENGFPLLILWIGEAAIILAGGVAFPILALYSGDPVCHDCRSQCKRVSNLPRFAVERQNEFLAAIENRDFKSLATHKAAKHHDHPELSLRLMSCPNCGKLQVLTVNRIEWQLNPQRRRFVKTTPLIDQLLITPAETEELKTICATIREQRESLKNLPQSASSDTVTET
jgi:hypothetical protein